MFSQDYHPIYGIKVLIQPFVGYCRSADALRKQINICLITFLCIIQTSGALAQGWYDNNWSYRKEITIDYTKVGSTGAPHSNFPVLVSLSSDSDLSSNARSDGYDILFTSSNGTTKLDYDRESYSSGTLVAWVEIPSLSASANTVIYMYYGYASASDQQNKTATWNSNYIGVWHLTEDASGTGTTSLYKDATSNANHGTDYVSSTGKTGKIGSGQQFDGTDDYIDCGSNSALDVSGDISISFWVYTPNSGNSPDIITNGAFNQSYSVWLTPLKYVEFALNNNKLTSSGTITLSSWQYISITRSGSSRTIYKQGTANGTNTYGTSIAASGPLTICSSSYSLEGNLDEIRVSDVARSSGWINTEFNNQDNPSSFYSVGSQALPISLLYFNGRVDEHGAQLTWASASEINNDFYTIEKSLDGKTFYTLEEVKGAGTTTNIQEYTYIDNKYNSIPSYYRLKQTDFDGANEYFNIIYINTERVNTVKVMPNPVTGQFQLINPSKSLVSYQLVDLVGNVLLDGAITGQSETNIGVSNLIPGMYKLMLSTNGIIRVETLLVQ